MSYWLMNPSQLMPDHDIEPMGGIGSMGGIGGIEPIEAIGGIGEIEGTGLIGPPVAPLIQLTTAPLRSRKLPESNVPRWWPRRLKTPERETNAVARPRRS
jgi:hypothetical protein